MLCFCNIGFEVSENMHNTEMEISNGQVWAVEVWAVVCGYDPNATARCPRTE